MEIVLSRYNAFKQALITLGDGLEALSKVNNKNSLEYDLMRDGVIQRFEYCIDSFWKFLKIYLENYQKIPMESSSPRAILKSAMIAGTICEMELDVFFDCVSDRNITSHTYNEEMAQKIQSHIPLYYETMQNVIARIVISSNS